MVLSCLYATEVEAGSQEEILKTYLKDDLLDGEEKEFARGLFDKTFANREKLHGEIEPKLRNWKL